METKSATPEQISEDEKMAHDFQTFLAKVSKGERYTLTYIERANKFAGEFAQRYAEKYPSLRTISSTCRYTDLPEGMRSACAHIASTTKRTQAQIQAKRRLALAEDEWKSSYQTDPTFRLSHGDPDQDPGDLASDGA